jgi:hypothetical protein
MRKCRMCSLEGATYYIDEHQCMLLHELILECNSKRTDLRRQHQIRSILYRLYGLDIDAMSGKPAANDLCCDAFIRFHGKRTIDLPEWHWSAPLYPLRINGIGANRLVLIGECQQRSWMPTMIACKLGRESDACRVGDAFISRENNQHNSILYILRVLLPGCIIGSRILYTAVYS